MSCTKTTCECCGKSFNKGHRKTNSRCPTCSLKETKERIRNTAGIFVNGSETLISLPNKTIISYTCIKCGKTCKKVYDKYKDTDFNFTCSHCNFVQHYDFDKGWEKRRETWKITRPRKVKLKLRKHVIEFEDFIEKLDQRHKDNYIYDEKEYMGYRKKMKITCKIHGEFYQLPYEHVDGVGCPKCASIVRAQSRAKAGERSFWKNLIKNPDYDYSKIVYTKSREKVEVICNKHGSFWISPNKLLQGRGCPCCKNSKGENTVRLWLLDNNIEFERQKSFEDLRYKQPLFYDFYLPKYNLCIEYDGEQHFKPVNFRKACKDTKLLLQKFEENKIRDELKNEYCKLHSINLLRISYKDDIIKMLNDYFMNLNSPN